MRRSFRHIAALTAVAALGVANALTQGKYLSGSTHTQWAPTLTNVRELAALPPHVPVAFGLPDRTLQELAALYTQGHPTWSLDGFVGSPFFPLRSSPEEMQKVLDLDIPDKAVQKQLLASTVQVNFELSPGGPTHLFLRFEPPPDLDLSTAVVLLPTSNGSVINQSQNRPSGDRFYTAKLADQHNLLAQIDSSLGRVVTPGHQDDVGLWQREGDFIPGGHGIQAVGRHLLFEVVGPVAGSRLLLDFTSAGLAQQDYALPPAMLYGAAAHKLAFDGRGSGRLLSPPLEPREIGGHYYLALDLGEPVAHFPSVHGNVDPRGLVGFVRNISLLAPDQAAALQPPPTVPSFPAGLQAPGLLYSGVSEDGWVADKVWFQLATAETSNRLHIKGEIPGLGPQFLTGVIKIRVDGEAVGEQPLNPGAFDLDLPVAPKSGPRRVELEATTSDHLAKPDGRLVSCHLVSVALEQRPPSP